MKGFVNGIDWVNAEAMKYWSFTAATPEEKRRQEVHNMIFSGDYIGAMKVDGYYERLIKDEVLTQMGGTIAMRSSRYDAQKKAVDEINEKFGYILKRPIELEFYDGVPTSEKNTMENDEEGAESYED